MGRKNLLPTFIRNRLINVAVDTNKTQTLTWLADGITYFAHIAVFAVLKQSTLCRLK